MNYGSSADWALVLITLIYAGFTIGIFLSNRKANELTRKQLDDSKRQYEESKRLEIMPYFRVECKVGTPFDRGAHLIIPYLVYNKSDGDVSRFKLILENVGLGTAKNISHFWAIEEYANMQKVEEEHESPSAIKVGESVTLVYQIWHPTLEMLQERKISSVKFVVGLVYEDLLSTKYERKILITFRVENKKSPDWDVLIPTNCEVLKETKIDETPEQNT